MRVDGWVFLCFTGKGRTGWNLFEVVPQGLSWFQVEAAQIIKKHSGPRLALSSVLCPLSSVLCPQPEHGSDCRNCMLNSRGLNVKGAHITGWGGIAGACAHVLIMIWGGQGQWVKYRWYCQSLSWAALLIEAAWQSSRSEGIFLNH